MTGALYQVYRFRVVHNLAPSPAAESGKYVNYGRGRPASGAHLSIQIRADGGRRPGSGVGSRRRSALIKIRSAIKSSRYRLVYERGVGGTRGGGEGDRLFMVEKLRRGARS